MLLKTLSIAGFKSFADRTRLDFDQGVNVVVGPNGSGKSNLLDALAWVMGTQATSALRTQKMEDVIWGGDEPGACWDTLADWIPHLGPDCLSPRSYTRFALVEGLREEASLGARTTLDVLNAEQELLDAEASLIAAISDEYVAAYTLLASMGLLTADNLNLRVKRYDPAEYYNLIKNGPAVSQQSEKLNRVLKALGKD